jgi:hypothetical protein
VRDDHPGRYGQAGAGPLPHLDATTVWQYREQLVQAGVVEELFGAFDAYLKAQGRLTMGGQMIDASMRRETSKSETPARI